ncbi:dihydrodipicolinate synthase family protein [Mycolicibacterium confluentis]|uniref:Dihydrodipicolinate synthase family protein n=1 Tax=Mycolicibacterium confluentis TaxID=28047 RepID=A0A7I7XWJ1_9MYCO|nr:dihydrodipicolinate synthase family protein [Mycolicibacterium confluentis]MCV7321878.1 dihydrodipicolinate synthase family protein [Mycolicibacterium confluentis]ORV32132.1 dihydrodipicolinate synthase family protein [Mycolicibacterium confluentis]BBZ33695.1 dihydrodipicolinate synthase family protein [Mycolicibacterium confluentis]
MSLIRGAIPVVPTVFNDEHELDCAGQRRVVDFLVDARSAAICAMANYSEQFSLTDTERDVVVETTIDQAAGRIPVCVATSHYSARVAAERSRRAQEQGAALVMLMPPFVGASVTVDERGVVEYFTRVAEAIDIPIMIQDAPMSPTPLSAELLARLARTIPHVQYAKIEVAHAADKIRRVHQMAGEDMPGLYDGEEAVTLIPDLLAGAQGTMSSSMIPEILAEAIRLFHDGERDAAQGVWEDALPLIQFENRQCGLRATKILLKEGGIIGSDATRSPMRTVHPDTRVQLIELAKRKNALILRWA